VSSASNFNNIVRRITIAEQPQWRVLVTLEYDDRLHNEHHSVVV
jgi:hypothetical protein